ncbi:unnamed protein product [Prorocentrum cordatum]|uniref:Uncharacterized protein n=1 Tax=Prorocentrum cordatum TaxID=2364126 RepID=A0ABN9TRU5_9DINO|nr:unnamed protein product [Polarella glacialis]
MSTVNSSEYMGLIVKNTDQFADRSLSVLTLFFITVCWCALLVGICPSPQATGQITGWWLNGSLFTTCGVMNLRSWPADVRDPVAPNQPESVSVSVGEDAAGERFLLLRSLVGALEATEEGIADEAVADPVNDIVGAAGAAARWRAAPAAVAGAGAVAISWARAPQQARGATGSDEAVAGAVGGEGDLADPATALDLEQAHGATGSDEAVAGAVGGEGAPDAPAPAGGGNNGNGLGSGKDKDKDKGKGKGKAKGKGAGTGRGDLAGLVLRAPQPASKALAAIDGCDVRFANDVAESDRTFRVVMGGGSGANYESSDGASGFWTFQAHLEDGTAGGDLGGFLRIRGGKALAVDCNGGWNGPLTRFELLPVSAQDGPLGKSRSTSPAGSLTVRVKNAMHGHFLDLDAATREMKATKEPAVLRVVVRPQQQEETSERWGRWPGLLASCLCGSRGADNNKLELSSTKAFWGSVGSALLTAVGSSLFWVGAWTMCDIDLAKDSELRDGGMGGGRGRRPRHGPPDEHPRGQLLHGPRAAARGGERQARGRPAREAARRGAGGHGPQRGGAALGRAGAAGGGDGRRPGAGGRRAPGGAPSAGGRRGRRQGKGGRRGDGVVEPPPGHRRGQPGRGRPGHCAVPAGVRLLQEMVVALLGSVFLWVGACDRLNELLPLDLVPADCWAGQTAVDAALVALALLLMVASQTLGQNAGSQGRLVAEGLQETLHAWVVTLVDTFSGLLLWVGTICDLLGTDLTTGDSFGYADDPESVWAHRCLDWPSSDTSPWASSAR